MHRKQVIWQVILPVVFAAFLLIGVIVLISLDTLGQGGETGRWAAISTIWIITPIMIVGIILLAVLIALIYLLARALGSLPHYTSLAQDYVYKARGYVSRGADMVVKPILVLDGFLGNIKAFFGRIKP